MKRIAKFLLMAAVAGLAIVACNKPNSPSKNENKDQGQDQDKGQNDPGEPKLAIDGNFDEWESVATVAGDSDYSLILMKAQMDDSKLYFYLEADASDMYMEDSSYSNYLTLYLDCNQDGAEKVSYWGGEEGFAYDVTFQIWLMVDAKAKMANWWSGGFSGKAKIVDGIYKAEFSLGRSSKNQDDAAIAEALKSKAIYFGAVLTDQYVEHPEPGQDEGAWQDGEEIGFAPALEEEPAPIRVVR